MKELDSVGTVWVKPGKTTTYILKQKDFKFDETVDTIVVFVDVPVVDAGGDRTICKGENYELRITNYELRMKYLWMDKTYQVLGTWEVGCKKYTIK